MKLKESLDSIMATKQVIKECKSFQSLSKQEESHINSTTGSLPSLQSKESTNIDKNSDDAIVSVSPKLSTFFNINSSHDNTISNKIESSKEPRIIKQSNLPISCKKGPSDICSENSKNGGTERVKLLISQVNAILKHLCSNCSNKSNNIIDSSVSCSNCNSLLCNECQPFCRCLTCDKNICEKHCVKCALCNRRSCKLKSCINDFRICQMCEYTYCNDHFESHKKFNQKELYGMKCTSTKCKIGKKIDIGTIEQFAVDIVNASNIKEIRLRNIMTKKVTTSEIMVLSFYQIQ